MAAAAEAAAAQAAAAKNAAAELQAREEEEKEMTALAEDSSKRKSLYADKLRSPSSAKRAAELAEAGGGKATKGNPKDGDALMDTAKELGLKRPASAPSPRARGERGRASDSKRCRRRTPHGGTSRGKRGRRHGPQGSEGPGRGGRERRTRAVYGGHSRVRAARGDSMRTKQAQRAQGCRDV